MHEGVLAGADRSLHAVANQLGVDIQTQLAAVRANGEDALLFDESVLAPVGEVAQDFMMSRCNVNVNADV